MDKQVVLVGVLDVDWSTDIDLAWAFATKGFGVVPINYRTIIKNQGYDFFAKMLFDYVQYSKPDLVWFSKCNGVSPRLVEECTKHTKTWLFNPDPIQTIQISPEVIEHAKRASFSSCNGLGVAQWFERNGAKGCMNTPQGYDPNIYKPVQPVLEYKAYISFIGGISEDRKRMKEELEAAGLDVKFYGPGFGPEKRNKEFAEICCSSRFMLNLNTYNDTPGYFSDRLPRALGCGACVVHYDPTDSIKDFFVPDKELITFKTIPEAVEKMASISDEDYRRMKIAGHERAIKEYTVLSFVDNIIKIVGV